MTPPLHLQEPDRRSDPHREDGEYQPDFPRLFAGPRCAAEPQLVVVPEVAGVEHVAPPVQKHTGQQSVVRDEVQCPAHRVDGGVDDDQVAEQGDEHRPDRHSVPLRPAKQPNPAEEEGQAEDAESCGADQEGSARSATCRPGAARAATAPCVRRGRRVHHCSAPRRHRSPGCGADSTLADSGLLLPIGRPGLRGRN